jgi:acyl-CoA-binding protein
VDSRSAIVLEGREPTKWFYIASAVMGLVLVVLGVTFLQISRRMKYAFREDRKANADYEVSMREEAVRTAEAARYYKPEISPELQKKFDQAQQLALQKVRETTPWHQKLTIFGLYHQALEGDVHQSRPGFLDRQERSKYDAWARHRGMSRTEAMQRYIEAVNYIESNN